MFGLLSDVVDNINAVLLKNLISYCLCENHVNVCLVDVLT